MSTTVESLGDKQLVWRRCTQQQSLHKTQEELSRLNNMYGASQRLCRVFSILLRKKTLVCACACMPMCEIAAVVV